MAAAAATGNFPLLYWQELLRRKSAIWTQVRTYRSKEILKRDLDENEIKHATGLSLLLQIDIIRWTDHPERPRSVASRRSLYSRKPQH